MLDADFKAKTAQKHIFSLLREKLYGTPPAEEGGGEETTNHTNKCEQRRASNPTLLHGNGGSGGPSKDGFYPLTQQPSTDNNKQHSMRALTTSQSEPPPRVAAGLAPPPPPSAPRNGDDDDATDGRQQQRQRGLISEEARSPRLSMASNSRHSSRHDLKGGGGFSSGNSGSKCSSGACWLCSSAKPPFVDYRLQLLYSVSEDFPSLPPPIIGTVLANNTNTTTTTTTEGFEVAPSKASKLNRKVKRSLGKDWDVVDEEGDHMNKLGGGANPTPAAGKRGSGDSTNGGGGGGGGDHSYSPPAPRFPPIDISKMLLCLPCFRLCYDGFSRPALLKDEKACSTRTKLSDRVKNLALALSVAKDEAKAAVNTSSAVAVERRAAESSAAKTTGAPGDTTTTTPAAKKSKPSSAAAAAAVKSLTISDDDDDDADIAAALNSDSSPPASAVVDQTIMEMTIPLSASRRQHNNNTNGGSSVSAMRKSQSMSASVVRRLGGSIGGGNGTTFSRGASMTERRASSAVYDDDDDATADREYTDVLEGTTALFVNTRGNFLLAEEVLQEDDDGPAHTTPSSGANNTTTTNHGASASYRASGTVVFGDRERGTVVEAHVPTPPPPLPIASSDDRLSHNHQQGVVVGQTTGCGSGTSQPSSGTVVSGTVVNTNKVSQPPTTRPPIASGVVVGGTNTTIPPYATVGNTAIASGSVVVSGPAVVSGETPSYTSAAVSAGVVSQGKLIAHLPITKGEMDCLFCGEAITEKNGELKVLYDNEHDRNMASICVAFAPNNYRHRVWRCGKCTTIMTVELPQCLVCRSDAPRFDTMLTTGAVIGGYIGSAVRGGAELLSTAAGAVIGGSGASSAWQSGASGNTASRGAANTNSRYHTDPYADYGDLPPDASVMNPTQCINELLLNIGAERQTQTGDGNCLFRSLAHQLFGQTDCHPLVREMCCDFIEGAREDYEPLVVGMGLGVSGYPDGHTAAAKHAAVVGGTTSTTSATDREELIFPQYVARMRMSGTWGDELCVHAAARLFSVRIHVLTSDYPTSKWHLVFQPDFDDLLGESGPSPVNNSNNLSPADAKRDGADAEDDGVTRRILNDFDDCGDVATTSSGDENAKQQQKTATNDSSYKDTAAIAPSKETPTATTNKVAASSSAASLPAVTDIFLLYLRPVHYDDIVSPPMVQSVMVALAEKLQQELTAEEEWIE